jgi:hypothetical protein
MKNQEEILSRIARYLMLYGSFIGNIGLLNGKTGIAVFFYHYARYTGKKIYDDFAGELIDEIYKEIHRDIPLNFRDGLCSIVWGLEYLIRNRFVEANPDAILEESDKRIREWDVRHLGDNSLATGLKGIACYVISRRQGRTNENPYITPEYIDDLITALKINKDKDDESECLIKNLEGIIHKEELPGTYDPMGKLLFDIIGKIRYRTNTIFEKNRPIGINDNGFAGIGLQLMKIKPA